VKRFGSLYDVLADYTLSSNSGGCVRNLRWAVASLFVTICACSSANVPPEQAKVTLSNTRIEQQHGEDVFLVDYQFTSGRPERGWQYQLVITSESGNEYTIDRWLNETQVRGTIEGTFKHFDAREEPGKRFEAFFQMHVGGTSELRKLSNTVQFQLPGG
jgi:hypothetical protein